MRFLVDSTVLIAWAITREMASQAGGYRDQYAHRGQAILTTDALFAPTATAVGATLVAENGEQVPMPEITTIRLMS